MVETAASPKSHPLPDTASPAGPEGPSRGARLAELLLAAAVVALGVLMVVETGDIRVPRSAARVGPRVIPYIVAAGLVLTGLWLAVEVLLGRTGEGEGGEDVDLTLPGDWRCLGIIAAALLAYLLLIERAGFVIASALLFFGAAYGMGSRRIVRDLAVGVVLSVITYLIFTLGLDLRLPAGVLGGVL
jgi:putative tricarboxylic transport membrane protein